MCLFLKGRIAMNDIFEVDFFDDDIVEEDVDTYNSYDDAYEDVDVFDEDYFEAMEGGNRDNKVSKKKWEKRQVESDEFKSQVANLGPHAPQPSTRLYRQFNNPNSAFLEGKQAKRKGADNRDYYLAQNAGQSVSARQKRHDVDREDNYTRRYNAAQSRILGDRANKRDYRVHKNVVHEMNHPTKVYWD